MLTLNVELSNVEWLKNAPWNDLLYHLVATLSILSLSAFLPSLPNIPTDEEKIDGRAPKTTSGHWHGPLTMNGMNIVTGSYCSVAFFVTVTARFVSDGC